MLEACCRCVNNGHPLAHSGLRRLCTQRGQSSVTCCARVRGPEFHACGLRPRAELAAGAAFLDALREASGALLIEGEPGIGKSTVWSAIVRSADAGSVRVLQSRPGRERGTALVCGACRPGRAGLRRDASPLAGAARARSRGDLAARRLGRAGGSSHDGHGCRRRAWRACAGATGPHRDRRRAVGGRGVVPGARVRGTTASFAGRAASDQAYRLRCDGATRSRRRDHTRTHRAAHRRSAVARVVAPRHRESPRSVVRPPRVGANRRRFRRKSVLCS